MTARKCQPMLERFWSKVDKTESCWLWTGSLTHLGYGLFKNQVRHMQVHRLAYELTTAAEIPEGLVLDHLCRVRNCVNPEHLEPVTQAENMRRGEQANRTHCPNGHPRVVDNIITGLAGKRSCRACTNRRNREYRARLKAQAAA